MLLVSGRSCALYASDFEAFAKRDAEQCVDQIRTTIDVDTRANAIGALAFAKALARGSVYRKLYDSDIFIASV